MTVNLLDEFKFESSAPECPLVSEYHLVTIDEEGQYVEFAKEDEMRLETEATKVPNVWKVLLEVNLDTP